MYTREIPVKPQVCEPLTSLQTVWQRSEVFPPFPLGWVWLLLRLGPEDGLYSEPEQQRPPLVSHREQWWRTAFYFRKGCASIVSLGRFITDQQTQSTKFNFSTWSSLIIASLIRFNIVRITHQIWSHLICVTFMWFKISWWTTVSTMASTVLQ